MDVVKYISTLIAEDPALEKAANVTADDVVESLRQTCMEGLKKIVHVLLESTPSCGFEIQAKCSYLGGDNYDILLLIGQRCPVDRYDARHCAILLLQMGFDYIIDWGCYACNLAVKYSEPDANSSR